MEEILLEQVLLLRTARQYQHGLINQAMGIMEQLQIHQPTPVGVFYSIVHIIQLRIRQILQLKLHLLYVRQLQELRVI